MLRTTILKTLLAQFRLQSELNDIKLASTDCKARLTQTPEGAFSTSTGSFFPDATANTLEVFESNTKDDMVAAVSKNAKHFEVKLG